jgi:hypothetical protein
MRPRMQLNIVFAYVKNSSLHTKPYSGGLYKMCSQAAQVACDILPTNRKERSFGGVWRKRPGRGWGVGVGCLN